DGKVGVQTQSPVAPLDVNGTIRISNAGLPMGLITEVPSSNTPILNMSINALVPGSQTVDASIGGVFRIDSRSNTISPLFQWLVKPTGQDNPFNSNILMSLTEDGKLGLGTNNPTKAKLEIVGAGPTQPISNYGFLGPTSFGNEPGAASNIYSIYTSNAIAASDFNAHSDRRIKYILGISNKQEDLDALMAIEVTNYQFIDTIQKGTRIQKKVIAQQMDEVYPLAVKKHLTEVIPDIYQRAGFQDGWIKLETGLKVGDRIKIITSNSNDIYQVTAIETDRFKVSGLSVQDQETVFVYGREVDDFHTVDYEAISMLNVSATQAQQNRIENLEAEIALLQEQVRRIDQLEIALNALQNQNQQMVESQQETASHESDLNKNHK
ncbi:MAG: tail fiber domain-containing protein, partial [Bacteroidota bacterium]